MEHNREYYAQYYEMDKESVRKNYKRKDAIKKRIDKIDKEIDLIVNLKEITKITIKTEWSKGSIYGWTPHTEVLLSTKDEFWSNNLFTAKGTAGGYGYDKHSTAVANALNELLPIKKLLMDNWEFGKEECLGYGANSYGNVPYFNYGVGMECFRDIFEELGYSCTEMHGETFDGYIFQKV